MDIDSHWHFLPVNFPELVRDIHYMDNLQSGIGPRVSRQMGIASHSVAPHPIEARRSRRETVEDRLVRERPVGPVGSLYAVFDWAQTQMTMRMVSTRYNALSRTVQDEPERLVGQASVPLQDPATASEEPDRAVTPLKLKGVTIESNV